MRAWKLQELEDCARDFDGQVIIAGYFSAKALEWDIA